MALVQSQRKQLKATILLIVRGQVHLNDTESENQFNGLVSLQTLPLDSNLLTRVPSARGPFASPLHCAMGSKKRLCVRVRRCALWAQLYSSGPVHLLAKPRNLPDAPFGLL